MFVIDWKIAFKIFTVLDINDTAYWQAIKDITVKKERNSWVTYWHAKYFRAMPFKIEAE